MQWERACALLSEMKENAVEPNAISYFMLSGGLWLFYRKGVWFLVRGGRLREGASMER